MLKLIKNTELYTPVYEEKKDILIANDRIVKIEDEMNITGVGRPNH
jgi:beta-aspartyl-dipeptidase (metallo-type)